MALFILKRLGLGLITLLILSAIVFFAAQVLPGDPARAILGPFAQQSAVNALSRQLGTNRSVFAQYGTWIGHVVTGNLGTSYAQQAPIAPILGKALVNSLKLAALAFIIVVPLAIFGGVEAALHVGKLRDRLITIFGLTATVIPEVVTGIVLILVFGLWLNILPISATAPPGSGIGDQIYHLILPAIPLVLILFGYISQMARAGTVEALNSDYARTATLKGLPRGVMIRRHILRNSLLPTITVIATQTGYLIGGLVLVEVLFNYNGIGKLILTAANQKDFPMLEACVLVIGAVYILATLVADVLFTLLNPRIRYRGVE
ncbi:MAG TPA: ABC transporter permease [Solirubrobacteraceae bacterium]|nr:ABC transporter permease [Solirubrobacteraceae bacterium]